MEERIERYELLGELATGGMATVYLGRQRGPFGFVRTVAIKSMHPQFAKDEGFRAMFLDEATLTAKIRHPNVVPTLDIVCASTKLLLVMEYVDGVSLWSLLKEASLQKKSVPPAVAVAVMCDALQGLHAAHELVDDTGQPLGVIHRDVSPQNVHVGLDGLARILDFGVAKATTKRYVTQTNEIKGKLAYMPPEQLCGEPIDRRIDVYAAGVVLWEAFTGRRLFGSSMNEGELVKKILEGNIPPPGMVSDEPIPAALDDVVMRALAKKVGERWETAADMAKALAEALPPAPRAAVTAVVKDLVGRDLSARASRLNSSGSMKLEPDAQLVADLLTEQATRTGMPTVRTVGPLRRDVVTRVAIAAGILLLTAGAFVVGTRAARAPQPPAREGKVAELPSGVSALPSAAPSASVAVSPSTPAPFAKSASAAPSAPPPRWRPVRKPRPGVDCRIPYTVDANGDRHYKPECVE